MPASRTVFAAAHVVADPNADNAPGAPSAVDWDATLAFRHRLWSLGLGIADAMDTAQRGMGLDWAATQELIRRSGAEARAVGGLLCCGVGTDQLVANGPATGASALADIVAAYEQQLEVVEQAGAQPVLMCSRALAAGARGADDYADVYARVIGQASSPVILHWLGDMFDPALRGYWGGADLDGATESVLAIINEHAAKIDGIKVSLLDADREIALRRRLPRGVRLYTGDDFNFPELVAGDEHGFSHALLGIFDPLATQAAQAFALLDAGDVAGFRGVLDPLVPLARHIFAAPTQFYKTGVVFLAYLSGYQDHFTMLGGQEAGRDREHLAKLYEMAVAGGILPDAEVAAARFKGYCGD
ncbi:dihydrodipicolinate synthase family protein [Actinospica sp. MGRD01-02]|uniref:Dihydrodipicolinate synthase family protein n=1 Tax=Actinospica acidithermotolerans TaxID=2828514 RepID=A0A941ECI4_9ACTN|nr:dihydrodipicolinate synthase family protein [Actinospica acidithermotolerans]MBR7826509.1 dihydrodipicolinate synthase family protein [Actinospica acidithermotolerans]